MPIAGDTDNGNAEPLTGSGSVKHSASSQNLRQHFSDSTDTYSSTPIDTSLLFPQSYSDAMQVFLSFLLQTVYTKFANFGVSITCKTSNIIRTFLP